MQNQSLYEIVNSVEDEESFIRFIKALEQDRAASVNNEITDQWENNEIETFLEAAHAWAEASKDGMKYYKKPENVWKRCAQILYMGKLYE